MTSTKLILPLAAIACLTSTALAQDECATASTNFFSGVQFDTTAATQSPEPWNCAGGGGPDLWLLYTINPGEIAVTFDLCGSTFDTALEVYSGSCGNLSLVECNDDFCGLQSSVTVTGTTPGDDYLIRIGGFNGASGIGVFNITPVMASPGDECLSASSLTPGVAEAFDTSGATVSSAFPCASGGGPDLWYTFVADPAFSGFSVETCGSSYDTALEVFEGACGALTPLTCNDDSCGLQSSITIDPAVAGQTYTIRVGGFNGATGAGTILATNFGNLFPDACADARPLMNGVPMAFDTSPATPSSPGPFCALGGNDLWFSYTAAVGAPGFSVDTCGSSFDTTLEVFEGTCGALTALACNDDACGLQSAITVDPAVPGQTYLIRVGGSSFLASGLGTVQVNDLTPPPAACLPNPSFETGDLSNWTAIDFTNPLAAMSVDPAGRDQGFGFFPSEPTDGSFAFSHGWDSPVPGDAGLNQVIDVVPGTSPLTFDYRVAWDLENFGATATQDRVFDVFVIDPVNATLLQIDVIFTISPSVPVNLDTGPLVGSIDLSAFEGSSVLLSFGWSVPEASTGPAFFQLDNFRCPNSPGNGVGTNYCTAAPTSLGRSATMSASGSHLVSANNLTITASNLPPNQFGIFVASPTQGFAVGTNGTSNGNLCIAAPGIGRFPQIVSSGANGTYSIPVDLSAIPSGNGSVAMTPGDTYNFQSWFRDTGGLASNYTDGLSITFE